MLTYQQQLAKQQKSHQAAKKEVEAQMNRTTNSFQRSVSCQRVMPLHSARTSQPKDAPAPPAPRDLHRRLDQLADSKFTSQYNVHQKHFYGRAANLQSSGEPGGRAQKVVKNKSTLHDPPQPHNIANFLGGYGPKVAYNKRNMY